MENKIAGRSSWMQILKWSKWDAIALNGDN
jgi:hypothetical protein